MSLSFVIEKFQISTPFLHQGAFFSNLMAKGMLKLYVLHWHGEYQRINLK